jgi:hypothetical protein
MLLDEVKRKPRLLILPALVSCGLIVASVIGVYFGARLRVDSYQADVRALGASTLDAFSIDLKMATAPLHAISSLIRVNPNWTAAEPQLKRFITEQLRFYNISLIQVAPYFVGGIELPAGVADVNHDVNWCASSLRLPRKPPTRVRVYMTATTQLAVTSLPHILEMPSKTSHSESMPWVTH